MLMFLRDVCTLKTLSFRVFLNAREAICNLMSLISTTRVGTGLLNRSNLELAVP